ncbi:MAG: protein kinase domain-containing protein, partial [Nannocystaceae bacterium]
MSTPQHKEVPLKIGRYTVLELLGEGAMGVVYTAYDTQLDRKIAIKVLREEATAARTQKRLVREAQALARVSHPNVVIVHEIGEHEGQIFLAMEFVRGQTLEGWVQAKGPQAPWQV